MVSVEPIRNLSLIRSCDPLTWSSNFQAPLAHARETEMPRMSYFPHLQNATRLGKDENNYLENFRDD